VDGTVILLWFLKGAGVDCIQLAQDMGQRLAVENTGYFPEYQEILVFQKLLHEVD
jgi:hypothetical protein